MHNILRKQGYNIGVGGGSSNTNFVGTRQEWEALSSAQQNAYDTVDIVGEDGDNEKLLASITADGVKTFKQILNQIYASTASYFSFSNFLIFRYGNNMMSISNYMYDTTLGAMVGGRFSNMRVKSNNTIESNTAEVSADSMLHSYNGTTYSDLTNNIPESGTIFALYKV